jgi:hypothetical protein
VNKEEPKLPSHLIFFFQAFKNLGRQRQIGGFSLGCIPYLDIIAYSRIYRCDQETEEDLVYFVTGLDDHYLAKVNKDQKQRLDKQKTRKTSS